jgi:hypothetical protein
MHQKRPHSESPGKGVGNAKPLTKAEAKRAMSRFASLARQLLTVTRDQLQKEERKHKLEKRDQRQA